MTRVQSDPMNAAGGAVRPHFLPTQQHAIFGLAVGERRPGTIETPRPKYHRPRTNGVIVCFMMALGDRLSASS